VRLRELDLVDEGEHHWDAPPALCQSACCTGRSERPLIGDLDVDDTVVPLERHFDDVVSRLFPDGVRERLRGRELELEAPLDTEPAPLREAVDRSPKLARGTRTIVELEFDSRRPLDPRTTPSVPNEVPNCINGSNR
jgi:hypothetical protein